MSKVNVKQICGIDFSHFTPAHHVGMSTAAVPANNPAIGSTVSAKGSSAKNALLALSKAADTLATSETFDHATHDEVKLQGLVDIHVVKSKQPDVLVSDQPLPGFQKIEHPTKADKVFNNKYYKDRSYQAVGTSVVVNID